jgi:hypothetical protein
LKGESESKRRTRLAVQQYRCGSSGAARSRTSSTYRRDGRRR